MEPIKPPDLTEVDQQLEIIQELMENHEVEPFVDATYVKKMNDIFGKKLDEVIRAVNKLIDVHNKSHE